MAGLRFTDLQSRPIEFLDFTSVTLDEFQQLGLGQDLADTVYWTETPQQSATCSQALQSVSKKWEREETCGISPLSPVPWRTNP